jgi:uncharacterized protein (DUF1800 family)
MSVTLHDLAAKRRRKRRRRKPKLGTAQAMSVAMVDRLFWRAGFGPGNADRKRFVGKPVAKAVDWLLSAPSPLVGPAPRKDGGPLDPKGDDDDLVLEWLDRMIRAQNPFVERMAFFWHRHFANSRDGGPSAAMLRIQADLFRRYADFGRHPSASFRDLAHEVSVDPSMLIYLTGDSNVRTAPNENYAREIMELFCLGVTDAAGRANYAEYDVKQLAKAFSGWHVDDRADPDHPRVSFRFDDWYNGPKRIFGTTGNWRLYGRFDPLTAASDAVELVLSRPAHAPFLVRKLWHEFIVTEPPAATLRKLVATYTKPVRGRPGLLLKPLLRAILTHPLLFESLAEPNMVKPPVVYVVGMMRALHLGIVDDSPVGHLDGMGQVPYFPPNVSGWEGGLSWLNTNTALARFAFAGELLARRDGAPHTVPGRETSAQAVQRAHVAVKQPWLSAKSRAALTDLAAHQPSFTADQRVQRQRLLRGLLLAGPDAQVM